MPSVAFAHPPGAVRHYVDSHTQWISLCTFLDTINFSWHIFCLFLGFLKNIYGVTTVLAKKDRIRCSVVTREEARLISCSSLVGWRASDGLFPLALATFHRIARATRFCPRQNALFIPLVLVGRWIAAASRLQPSDFVLYPQSMNRVKRECKHHRPNGRRVQIQPTAVTNCRQMGLRLNNKSGPAQMFQGQPIYWKSLTPLGQNWQALHLLKKLNNEIPIGKSITN